MRKKIIYLDDVSHSLATIETRLQGVYDLFPVKTTYEMFGLLETVNPDLILLDILMPEENGFEILQKLKADPLTSLIPVIFLTTVNEEKVLAEGAKLGAVDFILKSSSGGKMMERINAHLNPKADKPIILAVDDSPSTLRTVNFLLNDKYIVRTLTHPEKATVLLDAIRPDLFLLDYNMPNVTGFDLIPLIRKHPDHAHTPIIFLTAEGTVDNLSVAIHMGARDFIVKPIDEESFGKKIADALQSYLYVRHLRALEA